MDRYRRINDFLHPGPGRKRYFRTRWKTTLFSLQKWTYEYYTKANFYEEMPDVSTLKKEYRCFFILSPLVYLGYVVFTSSYKFFRSLIITSSDEWNQRR